MMLGAEIIAKTLKSLEVKRVFLFPRGTIAPLLDALAKEGIEYICARNEQGAGYGAIDTAKVTGFPQVVMVTSGPGATNVLTLNNVRNFMKNWEVKYGCSDNPKY
ncbi:MAG: thiamine pyrophosphate-binding protein [Candidatus Bathyarchaeota archaeon]|nr:thiamine pyrophosphate-binding protein [Candidatus Bathyarchaeota archaeon]